MLYVDSVRTGRTIRGVDAVTAGEPYVLDVRVATGGTDAESTWHQRPKLRRYAAR